MSSVLIVEDDPDVRCELSRVLSRAGYATECVSDVAAARATAGGAAFEVVLLDLGLPGEEGLSAVERLGARPGGAHVIVITGRDEASLAVRALRAGAADYFVKPWERSSLLRAVEAAAAETRAARDLATARGARDETQIVGASPALRGVLAQAETAASHGRLPVLLTGECGTGKDVLSRQMHRWSPRAGAPYVAVNVACLPAALLESELFGHDPGAFTDARGVHKGLFEQAHGGTLFLDEIGELPVELQPKLLRVLEDQTFRRLGGAKEIRVDVRLIAATNRSLPEMIAKRTFREDLYYRLRVMEIALPPLRERTGDARALALHLVARARSELGAPDAEISASALACIEDYPWPGNVRELKNAVDRAIVLAKGSTIERAHLPPEVVKGGQRGTTEPATLTHGLEGKALSLESAVRSHVLSVYETTARNVTRTAAILGITRVSLRKKLRECGVYPVNTRPPVMS